MMKKWADGADRRAHAVEISALKFLNTPWAVMWPLVS